MHLIFVVFFVRCNDNRLNKTRENMKGALSYERFESVETINNLEKEMIRAKTTMY
jgi:hypothetical protein